MLTDNERATLPAWTVFWGQVRDWWKRTTSFSQLGNLMLCVVFFTLLFVLAICLAAGGPGR